jgi:hypothetical protein
MQVRSFIAAVAALTVASAPARAVTQEAPWRIQIVVDLSIEHVAEGVRDVEKPFVRYNPILMQRVPPDLALFAILHEQAHIVLGHASNALDRDSLGVVPDSSSPGALRVNRTVDKKTKRALELAADCAVAKRVATRSKALLETLIQRFSEMPDEDAGDGYPSPRERAETLKSCGNAPPAAMVG